MLENRIRDLLVSARAQARARGINAELAFHREKSSLIRLGNSSVALSTFEALTRLDVSVNEGRRVGTYSLNADITSAAQLDEVLGHALDNCRSGIDKDYEPIFGRVQETVDDSSGYDPALENLSPEAKTMLCSEVVKALKPSGKYDFSGSWSTGSTEMYYITTANDNEAWRRLTDGRFVMVLKEQDEKWELSVERTQKAAGGFTADDVIAEFRDLLPVYEKNLGFSTEVGRQRVMFGTQAVAQLLQLAVWGGFIGRMWEEKRSFTAANIPGDKLFPDVITITDDPANPNVFGMPFDFKGHRRGEYRIVENGVFRGLLYDSGTAAKYKKRPTGHDVENVDLVLGTGTAPAGIPAGRKLAGDALYIPHLHYVHMPDPTKGMFTCSSRFNAQRIQKGEFTAPLLSSRVTDTVPQVFSGVVGVSSRAVPWNESQTYGRREPTAVSVPEYIICDGVRISDVAANF